MHDVAVFHHVFLAFHVELSGLTYGSLRAVTDKVVVLDDLRADKSLFEIRVDDTGTLRSLPSLVERPGTHLHLSGREVRLQVQQLVGRTYQPAHARLFQPHFLQEHPAVFVRLQFGNVGFRLGRHNQDFSTLLFHRLTHLLHVLVAAYGAGFVHVAHIHHRLRGEQEQLVRYFLFVLRFKLHGACRFALQQRLTVAHQHLIRLFGHLVAPGLRLFLHLLNAAFNGFQVLQLKFRINDFLVAHRVHTAVHMRHVLIVEAAQHVQNGIRFTNVGQELVAQPFALAGPFHQSGNVHNFHGSGHYTVGVHQPGQFVQTVIGHRNHAHIGLDGAEREVGRLGFCV